MNTQQNNEEHSTGKFVEVGGYRFDQERAPTEDEIKVASEFVFSEPKLSWLSEDDLHRCVIALWQHEVYRRLFTNTDNLDFWKEEIDLFPGLALEATYKRTKNRLSTRYAVIDDSDE